MKVKKPLKRGRSKRRPSTGLMRNEIVERDGYECWPAQFSPRTCGPSSKLTVMHIIPQQTLEDMFPYGVWLSDSGMPALRADQFSKEPPLGYHRKRTLRDLQTDSRNGRLGCFWHHGDHDTRADSMKVPRTAVSDEAWEFAAELNLTWWLEKRYPAGVTESKKKAGAYA